MKKKLLALGLILVLLFGCFTVSASAKTVELSETRGVFTVSVDGNTVTCQYFTPSTDKKYPTLLIAPEFGLGMVSTQRYAKKLAEKGYAVVVYDNPVLGELSLDTLTDTEANQAFKNNVLKAVFKKTRKLSFVNKKKLVLAGCSQGGLSATLLGLAQQDKVAALVLYYPALCYTDEKAPTGYDASTLKTAKTKALFKQLKTFKKPVFICHGSDDSIVDVAIAKAAAKAFPKCTLKIIKGAGHVFLEEGNVTTAVKYTVKFLKTNVK